MTDFLLIPDSMLLCLTDLPVLHFPSHHVIILFLCHIIIIITLQCHSTLLLWTVAASVARHLYIRSPCGVKGLVKIYGGRQNNGTCPSHFCGGSSSVARKALQALEHLKIVEKDANGYDSVFVV